MDLAYSLSFFCFGYFVGSTLMVQYKRGDSTWFVVSIVLAIVGSVSVISLGST